MVITGITIFLFTLYACLIIYYLISWLSIPDFKSTLKIPDAELPATDSRLPTPDSQLPAISVIIPARNEEDNIGQCLKSVLDQSYPKEYYEVIVIDDFSEDGTAEMVKRFAAEKVSLISLQDHLPGKINSYKKKGIEIGIFESDGDLIVTTDADCIVPNTWLEKIATAWQDSQPVFIAAPVMYSDPATKSLGVKFLNIFQSLDFMTLQGITAASVYKKFHNMCNGANLAYEKKVFFEVGGFAGIDNIASGDDMLLMHKIAGKYPDRIFYLKSQEAIVETQPSSKLKEFINQRVRWASKADKYPDKKITAVLILVYFFNVWILFLGVWSIFYPFVWWFIGVIVAKTITELLFLWPVATFFKKKKLLWWFFPSQPFHIVYTVIAGWLGKFGSYEWKERRVR